MIRLNGIKIALVSLGCDKNLVDSEVALGQLAAAGAAFTQNQAEAQVIIINTCGFVRDAVDEAREAIERACTYKRDLCRAVIVTGCYAQRFHKQILEDFPIDGIAGVGEYDRIAEIVSRAMTSPGGIHMDKQNFDEAIYAKRILSTPAHFAYVKIAEGCDNHCTYCTIPQIRGKYKSRSFDSLIQEMENLAKNGVREVILIAQDTALYGLDNYGKPRLHELLAEIVKISGIKWIRLMYCYPEHISDELISEMANNPKVVKYLDMPIQHGVDKILRLMGRKSRRSGLLDIIAKLRAAMPDISLRTTIIAGFPNEDEADFDQLCDFIRLAKFDRLGVFAYSPEDGTPAAAMDNQNAEDVKNWRCQQIMEIQAEISSEKLAKNIGRELDVIVEEYQENCYGRSYGDAPGIDGVVIIDTDKQLQIGDFIRVRIIESFEHDLVGVLVNESCQ